MSVHRPAQPIRLAIGTRIKLASTTDPYTKLKQGDEGIVDHFDDIGTMFVQWDDGSNLGLIEGEDRWAFV